MNDCCKPECGLCTPEDYECKKPLPATLAPYTPSVSSLLASNFAVAVSCAQNYFALSTPTATVCPHPQLGLQSQSIQGYGKGVRVGVGVGAGAGAGVGVGEGNALPWNEPVPCDTMPCCPPFSSTLLPDELEWKSAQDGGVDRQGSGTGRERRCGGAQYASGR